MLKGSGEGLHVFESLDSVVAALSARFFDGIIESFLHLELLSRHGQFRLCLGGLQCRVLLCKLFLEICDRLVQITQFAVGLFCGTQQAHSELNCGESGASEEAHPRELVYATHHSPRKA